VTTYTQSYRSILTDISAEKLWESSTHIGSVNAELFPVKMVPIGKRNGKKLTDASSLNEIVYAADDRFPFLITLFGWIPLDLHKMGFDSLPVGQLSFIERSENFFMREWVHQREIKSVKNAVELTDIITMTPRLPIIGNFAMHIYKRVFARRHAYLRRRYGGDTE
jgi:hypothetical protein